MSAKRKARERLETLLTGLEDEVMRDEGCVDTDVAALRGEIETLVERHAGVARGIRQSAVRPGDASGKAAGVVELLRRWAGIGQEEPRSSGVPRVRMAFSGEGESGRDGADPEPAGGSASTRPGKKRRRDVGPRLTEAPRRRVIWSRAGQSFADRMGSMTHKSEG